MRHLGERRLRWAALGALVAGLTVGTVGNTATAALTGTLNMNASLRLISVLGPCPPGVVASACSERTSAGLFAGLGQVTGRYTFRMDVGPPTYANGWGKAHAYPVRFAVASKGEIHFELAAAPQCLNEEQDFAARTPGGWGRFGVQTPSLRTTSFGNRRVRSDDPHAAVSLRRIELTNG
jgi:hypothetical protein